MGGVRNDCQFGVEKLRPGGRGMLDADEVPVAHEDQHWGSDFPQLRLRDEQVPMPAGAALLCPNVDLSRYDGDIESVSEGHRAMIELGRACVGAYLASHSSRDPLVGPVLGDLAGLPPLLIQAADQDVMLRDAQALHESAQRHGVPQTCSCTQGTPTSSSSSGPFCPRRVRRSRRSARSSVPESQARPHRAWAGPIGDPSTAVDTHARTRRAIRSESATSVLITLGNRLRLCAASDIASSIQSVGHPRARSRERRSSSAQSRSTRKTGPSMSSSHEASSGEGVPESRITGCPARRTM